jgi:hypothetical protein
MLLALVLGLTLRAMSANTSKPCHGLQVIFRYIHTQLLNKLTKIKFRKKFDKGVYIKFQYLAAYVLPPQINVKIKAMVSCIFWG